MKISSLINIVADTCMYNNDDKYVFNVTFSVLYGQRLS